MHVTASAFSANAARTARGFGGAINVGSDAMLAELAVISSVFISKSCTVIVPQVFSVTRPTHVRAGYPHEPFAAAAQLLHHVGLSLCIQLSLLQPNVKLHMSYSMPLHPLLAGNTASSGGAVSLYMNSSAQFIDTLFLSNSADQDGGALYGYGTVCDDEVYHGINELQV